MAGRATAETYATFSVNWGCDGHTLDLTSRQGWFPDSPDPDSPSGERGTQAARLLFHTRATGVPLAQHGAAPGFDRPAA